jgi:hypothetical protein
MDVTKMPAPATAASRTPSASPAEQGPQSPANAAPIVDRADIRPLDIPAALQILLAEVRAAFELQAVAMDPNASVTLNSPPQAARALLQMLISAMPDESASMPAWNAVLTRVETALQAGLDRGIDAIIVWRDVAPSVVDAAKEARTLVFATLGDDPQNPVRLRPEWAGLGPRFERFWRRRRLIRRHLTDPDYSSGSVDDDGEQRT